MPDYNAIQKLTNEVQQSATPANVNNIYPTLSTPEISSGGRFPVYHYGLNNEDIYGRNQGAGTQFLNGVTKGLTTAGTTAIGGTAGLVNGVFQWIDDGKFSSFYDNDMTRSLDAFQQSMEVKYPNYVPDIQKNAKIYNPNTWFTANFWGDTIIKNAGYAVGAIASGAAWSKVGSMVANVARGLSTGLGAEIATNTALESALLTRQAGSLENLSAQSARLARQTFTMDQIKNVGVNVTRAGLATFGEASMEAFQAKHQYKDLLVREYQDKYGIAPDDLTLRAIDSEADKVGNFTMGANTLLLTATNYIQFPKILGKFWKGEKSVMNSRVNSVVLQDAEGAAATAGTARGSFINGARYATPKTKWNTLKNIYRYAGAAFAGTEALEEGSQFIIPIAAQDYFNKGRKGEGTNVLESFGKGARELFNSKEGQLSLLAGGITGGLVMRGLNPLSGSGFRGISRDIQNKRIRTSDFVDRLNSSMIGSGYMTAAAASINRAEVLSAEGEQALRNNNRLQYEDTRKDEILNYLLPRIQYGRYDLVKDDLMGMRNVASTEEGYAELIKNGYTSEAIEREDFINHVDSLMTEASTLDNNLKALNQRYGTETVVGEDGKRKLKYNQDVLGKMAYVAAKIGDYNKRIPQLVEIFNPTDIPIGEIMASVHNGIGVEGGLTEASFNELIDQIDAMRGIDPEVKDQMKENAADLVELSARREFKIREYEQMKANPQEWEEEAFRYDLAPEGSPDMSKVNFNEVEEEVTPGDYESVYNIVDKQANGGELTEEEESLREQYQNLYEQLTGTVDQARLSRTRDQALNEGWFQDTEGNPVAPTLKSNFFNLNEGNYTMRVNGQDRQGTLGYDPNSDSLFFEYEDPTGPKQIEVFNEDFNDSTIIADGMELVPSEYLSQEDTNAPNRIQVRLRNFMGEINDRQTQIQDEVNGHLKELVTITDEIKAQEKDATEFTKDYVESMSTLRDMQRDVEARYTELVQERDELNAVQEEVTTLLETAPPSLFSSRDLMEQQVADLESMSRNNGLLIPALQNIAKSATDLLTRLGKKVISRMATIAGIPSPSFTRVRQAFDRWNQSSSEVDLRQAVTALSQEYQNIQNFTARTLSQADLEWVNGKLSEMQEEYKGVERRLKAKKIVVDRLAILSGEVAEREEIVRTVPAQPVPKIEESEQSPESSAQEQEQLSKKKKAFVETRIETLEDEGVTTEEAEKQAEKEWSGSPEGTRQEKVREQDQTVEKFGDDSDKTPISRYFNATVLLPKSRRNKGYDQRLNIFLNKIGIFERDRRPNLRLLAVTRNNEASLGLSGFVDKYFQITEGIDKAENAVVSDQSAIDAPIGMVIVEMVDGQPVFIDQNGNRIDSDVNLVDKVLLTKMKAASLTWSTGETAYSDPLGLGEAFADMKREEFEQQRSQILESSKPQMFTFRTSQGRQREASASESPDIVGTLITEDQMKAKKSIIEVVHPEKGKNSQVLPGVMPGETVQVKAGAILLRTPDVLQKVYTRKLTDTEKGKVKEALTYLANNRADASPAVQKIRTYLEGSTFMRFGSNLETLTLRSSQFNLTDDLTKGKPFTTIIETVGLDPMLNNEHTNVRDGLIKSNRAFSEFTGIEDGVPQFREWPTYQEYILSSEGGRKPLVYAPIMVDKYLLFTPEQAPGDKVIKTKAAPEVVAASQAKKEKVSPTKSLVKGQSDLIKALTSYFTSANSENLTEEQKAEEKEKANSAAAIVLRTANVMVSRGLYETVEDVYRGMNFSNMFEELNKGAMTPQSSSQPSIQVTVVMDYDEISKNKFKPSEQLRFGQGTEFEAVVLTGPADLLELSSLASKDRTARSAKNPVSLTATQVTRMRELEQKLGLRGTEVNDRLKEIAKENRSKTVEKIVSVGIGTPQTSQKLNEGDKYTDHRGVDRVWGYDKEADKAFEIYTVMGMIGQAANVGITQEVANRFKLGQDYTYTKPAAIVAAQENPYYNVEIQPNGVAKLIGVFNPNQMRWEGTPKEVLTTASTRTEPSTSAQNAINLSESAIGIVESASTGTMIDLIDKVARFYQERALTPTEVETLNQAAEKANIPVNDFFSQGFQQYLREETAPDNRQITETTLVRGQASKLTDIFKKVRQFLVDIYDAAFGAQSIIKLSLPVKQMYMDMLGIGFAERETKRKGLSKEVFPKSLVGESFAPTMDTKDLVKGRNYKILGANSGSAMPVTVIRGETRIPVPNGQVAIQDGLTKEIKIVDISTVLSQLEDPKTEQVVKKERTARKDKTQKVVETSEEGTATGFIEGIPDMSRNQVLEALGNNESQLNDILELNGSLPVIEDLQYYKQQAIDVIDMELELLPEDIALAKNGEKKKYLEGRLDFLKANKDQEVEKMYNESIKDIEPRKKSSIQYLASVYESSKGKGEVTKLTKAIENLPPPQEIVAVVDMEQTRPTPVAPTPIVQTKPTKVKAPTATVDGLKTFAGPEDLDGGVFLKDGEPVYILPYFDGFVQVDQETYKAYNKASTPARGRTLITNTRKLGKVKVGSTVTLSQSLDGVEQEVVYEVTAREASSITVKNNRNDQILEVSNVSMKTGEDAAQENQIKTAFLNKYIGDQFKDINKFLNPPATAIQEESLPNLDITC